MALTKQNYKPQYKIEFSFDDGFKLDLKAANLLDKYKQKATFYIIIERVNNPGFMDWDDIKGLEARGHEIGSHTVSHPADLKKLFDEDLHYEIQNSKDMIETVLGHPISKFCYPRGRADERVKDFVKKADYAQARGTGRTGVIDNSDPFYLPGSVHIFQREEYGADDVLTYAKKVIDKVKREGGYCNIWGHSKEINDHKLWGVLEEILKYVS